MIFALGSGANRVNRRNAYAAGKLRERGFATLLFDLLSAPEAADQWNVFDIELLAARIAEAVE